jgi:hypothetical protein
MLQVFFKHITFGLQYKINFECNKIVTSSLHILHIMSLFLHLEEQIKMKI